MNIIFEDNFKIDTNDTEIDYKRTSSMFYGLDGDIAYPFTMPTTPEMAHKLGFPNLVNVSRKTSETYPVRLKQVNYQIARGNLKIRTGNAKNISADFTTTPGGILKNIWNKKLNEFDLGSEVIPTQNIDASVYKLDGSIIAGKIIDSLSGYNADITLLDAIKHIFSPSLLQIYKANTLLFEQTTPQLNVTPTDSSNISLFSDFLTAYNSTQKTNEVYFSNKQFLGVCTGISTDTFTIKFQYKDGLSNQGYITSATFTLNPFTLSTITNYLNDSLKPTWKKPYQFPQINNAKLYSSTSNFNGIINKTVAGDILRNGIFEKNKYSHVPMFYLTWVLKKIFLTQGYTAQGSFFNDPDIKKALIFSLTTTDKLIDGINYPINIHSNTLIYAQHLPSETFSEYLSMLIDEFGITIAFNEVTKIVDISFFDDFVQKTDYVDLSNFASAEPVTDFVEKKKVQLSWQLSGDSLAKEDTDPYLSMPTKALVQASTEEYEPVTLKIPGLTKDINNLPQIEAAGRSPLFAQPQNTSPLRFIFWEDNVGKIESTGLSLNLQSPKSIFVRFLKNKNLFEYYSETLRTTALMPLNQILSLDYRKPVKMYGIFLFIDTINLKLKGSKTWYLTELILKKFIY